MGKNGGGRGGSDKALQTGLGAVKTLGGQMHGEALADYGIAASANKAGYANLVNQQGKYGATLSGVGKRTTASLTRLTAAARANQRGVTATQNATVNRYGSALGGSIAGSFRGARAQAAAGVMNAGAALKQGMAGQGVMGMATDIASLGAVAQQAAGQYALSQALQQRNIIDNQTLAQLTGQMYQSAIDYNQQWDMWKRQQDYATKQATKAAGDAGKATVESLTGDAGQALAAQAGDVARTALADPAAGGDWSKINVAAAVQAWGNQYGYAAGDPQYAVMLATVRGIVTSPDHIAADSYGQAITGLYSGAKGWDNWGPTMVSSAVAGAHTGALAAYLATNPSAASVTRDQQAMLDAAEKQFGKDSMWYKALVDQFSSGNSAAGGTSTSNFVGPGRGFISG